MMYNASDKPKVIVKSKNIQTLIDYCIEQKIEFTVSPRTIANDEWEIDVNVKEIKKAIVFGMFLKENKFDLYGFEETAKKTTTAAKQQPAKKIEPVVKENNNTENKTVQPTNSLLSTEENNSLSLSMDMPE